MYLRIENTGFKMYVAKVRATMAYSIKEGNTKLGLVDP